MSYCYRYDVVSFRTFLLRYDNYLWLQIRRSNFVYVERRAARMTVLKPTVVAFIYRDSIYLRT